MKKEKNIAAKSNKTKQENIYSFHFQDRRFGSVRLEEEEKTN
jgi:hypothetical protein